MHEQLPRSVKSLKYRKCGIVPDITTLLEWLYIYSWSYTYAIPTYIRSSRT